MDNEEIVISITKIGERVDSMGKCQDELKKKYDGLMLWIMGSLGMMVLNLLILVFKK